MQNRFNFVGSELAKTTEEKRREQIRVKCITVPAATKYFFKIIFWSHDTFYTNSALFQTCFITRMEEKVILNSPAQPIASSAVSSEEIVKKLRVSNNPSLLSSYSCSLLTSPVHQVSITSLVGAHMSEDGSKVAPHNFMMMRNYHLKSSFILW